MTGDAQEISGSWGRGQLRSLFEVIQSRKEYLGRTAVPWQRERVQRTDSEMSEVILRAPRDHGYAANSDDFSIAARITESYPGKLIILPDIVHDAQKNKVDFYQHRRGQYADDHYY